MGNRPQRHTAFLGAIRPLVKVYRPSPETTAFAEQLNVRAVIGPAGIGKNTLMTASGLAIATVSTSREPKPSDNTYRRYFDFTHADDRSDVWNALFRDRSYVQAVLHPATGELYCTEVADFPSKEVNLLDVTAKEYRRMQQAGLIGTISAACIVTPTFEQWQTQWLTREGEKPYDYHVRMEEGYQSLLACTTDPNMDFVINDTIDQGGQALRELALGGVQSDAERAAGRAAAENLMYEITFSGALDF